MKGCLGCAGIVFGLLLLYGGWTIAKLAFNDITEKRERRLEEKAKQAEIQKAKEAENARIAAVRRQQQEAAAGAKRKQEAKDEKIQTFAIKEASKVWAVYQSLQSEIDVQNDKIEELRKTLVAFDKLPEQDADFVRICALRDEMIQSRRAIREKLEDAYIAAKKYEASPSRKDYQELHKKALEDGILEADAASSKFKEMRLNK